MKTFWTKGKQRTDDILKNIPVNCVWLQEIKTTDKRNCQPLSRWSSFRKIPWKANIWFFALWMYLRYNLWYCCLAGWQGLSGDSRRKILSEACIFLRKTHSQLVVIWRVLLLPLLGAILVTNAIRFYASDWSHAFSQWQTNWKGFPKQFSVIGLNEEFSQTQPCDFLQW